MAVEVSNIEPETVPLKYGRQINKTNYVRLDNCAYKAKAAKISEIKELTIIFKPLLSASYVEPVATKLR